MHNYLCLMLMLIVPSAEAGQTNRYKDFELESKIASAQNKWRPRTTVTYVI